MARWLGGLGYAVTCVDTAESALASMKASQPWVAICDVGLPVGVLPRLQREIPEQHREEDRRHERESAWERTEHPEAEHARDDRHARQDLPQQWRPRDRVGEHQRAPAERDERDQQEQRASDHTHRYGRAGMRQNGRWISSSGRPGAPGARP